MLSEGMKIVKITQIKIIGNQKTHSMTFQTSGIKMETAANQFEGASLKLSSPQTDGCDCFIDKRDGNIQYISHI